MKKFLFASLFTMFFVMSYAQTPRTVTKAELDSIKMALPSFRTGFVYFQDGTRETGALNIDCIRQMLQFIDTEGNVRDLANNASVRNVIFGKTMYVLNGGRYVEVVTSNDEVLLAVSHTVTLLNSQRKGAMGMTSETTNIQNAHGTYSDGGRYVDFGELSDDFRVIVKDWPYIYKGGKLNLASKRQFIKAFPDKKVFIEDYLSKTKVDFEDLEQVKTFFDAVKAQ